MVQRPKRRDVWAARRLAVPIAALCVALLLLTVAASRFDVFRTRGDVWLLDRNTKQVCTLGLEVVEGPCWPAVAANLAAFGFVRPPGVDWTVRAPSLQRAISVSASSRCEAASVWYADDARNVFLSDGHAYAVNAPSRLAVRDTVRVCASPDRPEVYAIVWGRDAAPAVRMR